MSWLVLYFGSILTAFTYLGSTSLVSRLTPLEVAAGAVAVGTVGGGWIALLICMLVGRLSSVAVFLTLVCCTAIIIWRYGLFCQRWGFMRTKRPLIDGDDWPALLLSAGLALPMWSLYSSRMIPEHNGSLVSGGSCFGDLPIHMQIAESFLSGCNQDMSWGGLRSPIFWPEPLTYPFLPDFHAALLVRAGAKMGTAFAVTGFLMASALWVLLYCFTVRMTRSRLGGVLAVAMTICAGGLGGPRWVHAEGWNTAMQNDVVQHDHTGEWKHLWFAFVPHILLPQRGGTFAYPLAVFSLLLVWLATDPEDRPAGMQQEQRIKLDYWARASMLIHAGAVASMLPLVQAHAFIGVGCIIGVVALGDAHKWVADPRLILGWAAAGVTTIALAGPQMTLFMKTVTKGAYGNFLSYGWLYKKDLYLDFGTPHDIRGFYRFWWHSLGPVLPLFTLAMALYVYEAYAARRFGRALMRVGGGVAGPVTFGKAVRDMGTLQAQAQLTADDRARAKRNNLPYSTDSDEEDRSLDEGKPRGGRASRGSGGTVDGHGHGQGGEEGVLDMAVAAMESTLLQPLLRLTQATKLDKIDAPSGLGLQYCNTMTGPYTRRPLDCLKVAVGALAVFLLGNYVNFQPWDRDNAKLYYIFIFVASALNGALIAAPVEALFSAEPGWSRLSSWLRCGPAMSWDLASVIAKRLAEPVSGSVTPTPEAEHAVSTGVQRSGVAAARAGRGTGVGGETASAAVAGTPHGASIAKLTAPDTATTRIARGSLSLVGLMLMPVLVVLACMSGLMLVLQEYKQTYPLFDAEARRVGLWFQQHTGPKDLVAHSNSHVQPCASLAGRPSLVAYYGWVSNHGYNANERLGDRDYILDNALKATADERVVAILDKYDIKYILAEHDNIKYQDHNGPLYQSGRLAQVHTQGRYRIFQVLPAE